MPSWRPQRTRTLQSSETSQIHVAGMVPTGRCIPAAVKNTVHGGRVAVTSKTVAEHTNNQPTNVAASSRRFHQLDGPVNRLPTEFQKVICRSQNSGKM